MRSPQVDSFMGKETKEKSKKGDKGKQKKNAQLIIRLNKDEKKDFLDICDEIDTSAAREVRRFIRDFIAENQEHLED